MCMSLSSGPCSMPVGQTVAGALRRMSVPGRIAYAARESTSCSTLKTPFLAGDPAQAQLEVERIAREVLTNPVIEEFTLRLEA